MDGDQLDYGYFRRKINGVASGVAAVVGQPVPPSTTIIVSSVKPVLGGQLPFPDNEGSVGNLVSAGGNVPGIPWTNPHEATDFGDRAIRPGVSFGNVVGFSRFGTPPEPGAGPAREDFPPNNNYDESIGFYSIPTGPIIGGELVSPGIRGLGLYPSVAEGWIAFTTREYASNVLVDLDGDGAATHTLVRAAQIFQSPSLRMGPPASIGCGYGPALETDPQFSPGHPLFGAVSLITIFLSPEDGAWPAPAGPCFAADTSLNQNSCFSSQPPPAPSYQDTDQVDIVVRWEAR